MEPRYLMWPQFGMRFIPLDAGHVDLAHDLAMVGLSPLGCNLLKAVHRLELHRTNVGSPCITDAPALTFQQPYDSIFGKFTPGQQGSLAFREYAAACRTAQPFDVFVRSCPRPRGYEQHLQSLRQNSR
jgi:hypothetical protein